MPVITGGWRTVLDLNLAAQSSQTFTTDGNYTVGGFTVTKTNSANDRVAMNITNGSGLILAPNAGGTDIFQGTFSMPCLAFPLNQFITVTPDTAFRLWMYVSSDNLAADFDQMSNGIGAGFTTATQDFNLTSKMENTGTVNQHRWRLSSNLAGSNLVNSTTQPSRSFTDNVLTTIIHMSPIFSYYCLTGTFSNGWPNVQNMNPIHSYVNTSGYLNWGTSAIPNNWAYFLAAGRVNSATSLTCTVARIRIDVINNP